MTPLAALSLFLLQAPRPFEYRGFSPGMAYKDFSARARAVALQGEILTCQTMRRSAQVMDCGVRARDPSDSADFYLSANVIEGRTSVISFVDSGSVSQVDVKQMQEELRRLFGPPHRRERSMWEWTKGRRFIRLNWRGARDWRVTSITLNDRDVMNRISKYVPKARRRVQ